MAVLVQAGPGGGVDIPAVKAVLHAQGLERYVCVTLQSMCTTSVTLLLQRVDLFRHETANLHNFNVVFLFRMSCKLLSVSNDKKTPMRLKFFFLQ